MKSYRPYAPSQPYLLPPSPSEWLPEGHLAYFILDLVEDLDLGEIERVLQAKDPRGERALFASDEGYGEELIERLSRDLQSRFGRGFGRNNLALMRAFYLARRDIFRTASGKFAGLLEPSMFRKQSGKSQGLNELAAVARRLPLPWSHYVRLLSVRNPMAQEFYETEALCGGWTLHQLERQIDSQFYERTALSRNKAAMLRSGAKRRPEDESRHEEHLKEPYFLEFLNLKDEYSESDLEEALIAKLETFLLELGGDFTFVGRQRRLRVGSAWYRVDLLFSIGGCDVS